MKIQFFQILSIFLIGFITTCEANSIYVFEYQKELSKSAEFLLEQKDQNFVLSDKNQKVLLQISSDGHLKFPKECEFFLTPCNGVCQKFLQLYEVPIPFGGFCFEDLSGYGLGAYPLEEQSTHSQISYALQYQKENDRYVVTNYRIVGIPRSVLEKLTLFLKIQNNQIATNKYISILTIVAGWHGGMQTNTSEKAQNNASRMKIEDPLHLEDRLKKSIFGQDYAIHRLCEQLVIHESGLSDPKKPIGTFLFVGPTGVGKTSFAKALAKEIFGSEENLTRIDMSEYTHKGATTKLLGAEPGYLGCENGGLLVNALKQNPNSVILLDEIEKADTQILKTFLHIFDEGIFTSGMGEKINCRGSLFILTSNLFSEEILNLLKNNSIEEVISILEQPMMSRLSPELYNRLEVIPFNSISQEALLQAIQNTLETLKERIQSNNSFEIQWDPSMIGFLQKEGYHPKLGLRPLQRVVERKILVPISLYLLENECKTGETISISFEKEKVQIQRI